jgi:outer membrane protein assembly factor BamA
MVLFRPKQKECVTLSLLLCFNFLNLSAQTDTAANAGHHLLVLPVIARSIETSWSFGGVGSLTFHIGKKDKNVRTSNFQALGIYSLKKQAVFVLNGTTYFPGEKYILNHQASFSVFPDKFWGIGKMAPDSAVEPYKFKQLYLYLHGQTMIANHLFVGILYEYQHLLKIDYNSGGLFDKQNVTGRKAYQVSGLGLSLMYDTRNSAFSPNKGGFIQGSFNHFDPFLGSDYRYTNYILDTRKFIATFKKQVLALQAYAFFNSGVVPLRSLAAFGGANSMRGYYAGRYRDRNQIVLQTEYRIPIIGRLGTIVFGGIGNVAHQLSDLNLTAIKYSYGGGLRLALNKSEKLNLRMDYGIGKGINAHGFYFQLGEAF